MINGDVDMAQTDRCNVEVIYNEYTTESFKSYDWMDFQRSIAVISVVVHHWFGHIPYYAHQPLVASITSALYNIAGTMVHLFFVLSGSGLTVSYFRQIKKRFSWKHWFLRRFQKIVIPYWIIITATYILSRLMFNFFPNLIKQYDITTLFAYLTFTRNFYEPGWNLNPSLWFMPVIIGLYMVFPILIKILQRFGLWIFLVVSACLTYLPISLAVFFKIPIEHQNSIFFYFIIEFSFGMLIGYFSIFNHKPLEYMSKFWAFCLGGISYVTAWAIHRFLPFGDAYNDIFTSVGVFLMSFYTFIMLKCLLKNPRWLQSLSKITSRHSYVMYLIHLPLIFYILRPILQTFHVVPTNVPMTTFHSFLYVILVFWLSWFIQPVLERIQTKVINLIGH